MPTMASPPSPPSGPSSVFTPYLSPCLASHLLNLPPTTPLDNLSRTTPSRLQTTALPNIKLIELVSSTDFARYYDSLYVKSFPRRTERERSDLIIERLAAQARDERRGLAPYRIVGIRDHAGEVIGAAQFSVLPVPPRRRRPIDEQDHDVDLGREPSDFKFAVPYLQYIYVRTANRRQDMSEVLHTMVLAVASADAVLMDREDGGSEPTSISEGETLRSVPFTLFETEPPDHGDDHVSRAYALERSKIHTSSGGMALVLRRPKHPAHQYQQSSKATDITENEEDYEILSAHVQPGLEPADPPLTLVWMIRPSPTSTPNKDYDLTHLGRALMAAYYQSLRDEGFPDNNIRLAERIVEARMKDSTFALMPLADVKDFRMEDEYLEIDGKDSKIKTRTYYASTD